MAPGATLPLFEEVDFVNERLGLPMAQEIVPRPEDELPELFLKQAHEAVFYGDLAANPRHILAIATDAGLRARFLDLVSTQAADPGLRKIISEYIEETADNLDSHVDSTDAFIELLDRSALPIASAAVLSGIGLIVSLGVTVGSITILSGGLVGLAVSGTSRTVLKLRGNRSKGTAKKLRRLAAQLRSM